MTELTVRPVGFGIANYRSFDGEGAFIRDFGNINVFIGKNNCGKSNILHFLKFLSTNAANPRGSSITAVEQHKNTREAPMLGVTVEVSVSNAVVTRAFETALGTRTPHIDLWVNFQTGSNEGPNPFRPVDARTLLKVHDSLTGSRYSAMPPNEQLQEDVCKLVSQKGVQELLKILKDLVYVPAIREVRGDAEGKDDALVVSGRNIIPKLRSMQHPLVRHEHEQRVFQKIQTFVRELVSVPDLVLEIPSDDDDIYLNMYDDRLPLASYGTGIHELVIICSALAIYQERMICIEEPEIHLHPELIRKFLRFLGTTTNTYFITTHSNVFLDADESVRIYHVAYDGTRSTVKRSETTQHARSILSDLSYRASDLLQSNGIIWVEGPSDRIYINKWLELLGSNFTEGVQYSIMFYGGSTLASLSAKDQGPEDDFIELLRINRNAFVVIDRDGASPKTALRRYKNRIQGEIGDEKCWITKGREIENYLRPDTVRKHLETRFPGKVKEVTLGADDCIEECIATALPRARFKYNKVREARVFSELMMPADLDVLNLRTWIGRIESAIEEWNSD